MQILESREPGVQSQLCHLLVLYPLASCTTSLNLRLPSKRSWVVPPSQDRSEKSVRSCELLAQKLAHHKQKIFVGLYVIVEFENTFLSLLMNRYVDEQICSFSPFCPSVSWILFWEICFWFWFWLFISRKQCGAKNMDHRAMFPGLVSWLHHCLSVSTVGRWLTSPCRSTSA